MLLTLLLPIASAASASVEGFTAFPTDIGVRGTVEGPARLRLSTSAGLLPRPYLAAINAVATDQEWYSEKDAGLIEAALEDALVLRLHGGWRPSPRHGFQVEVGYSWVGLGGGLTGAEIIAAEYGIDLSPVLGDELDFEAHATLHRLEASFGWEHPLHNRLFLRWDLGASLTLDARARVERQFDAGWLLGPSLDQLESDTEVKLEDLLERVVHTPILAVGLGWRFGPVVDSTGGSPAAHEPAG